MFSKKEPHYASLSGSEASFMENLEIRPERPKSFFKICILVMITLASSFISFFAGKQVGENESRLETTIPIRIIPQVLSYQRPFADDPKLQVGDIWDTMFPNNGSKGGYFAHPTIAPRRSTFSAYHQLHCLHAIREAYYVALDHKDSSQDMEAPSHMSSHTSPAHIRHCIDLIRQSLMCNADTTIEVKDEEINGVRGFGTLHQCKDWRGLVRWTEEMQEKYGMGEYPVLTEDD